MFVPFVKGLKPLPPGTYVGGPEGGAIGGSVGGTEAGTLGGSVVGTCVYFGHWLMSV